MYTEASLMRIQRYNKGDEDGIVNRNEIKGKNTKKRRKKGTNKKNDQKRNIFLGQLEEYNRYNEEFGWVNHKSAQRYRNIKILFLLCVIDQQSVSEKLTNLY